MQKMANVSAGRSEQFLQTALAVSDYLETLPLTNEQNNNLVELICRNVNVAERDAFGLGINIAGYAAALAAKEKRQPIEADFEAALTTYGAVMDYLDEKNRQNGEVK